MDDLIERLRADAELIHNNWITRKLRRHRVAALLREAADALERKPLDDGTWHCMTDAPRDGTEFELLLRHQNYRYRSGSTTTVVGWNALLGPTPEN